MRRSSRSVANFEDPELAELSRLSFRSKAATGTRRLGSSDRCLAGPRLAQIGHKPSSPTRAKILAQGADERRVCGSEIVTSPARHTINPAA